jgi:DNA polymerase-3 subunit epsilon
MDEADDLPQDLVFVDLETTGGSALHDRITEVGILRVEKGELVEEWSSLVNPDRPIPAYIAAFTGISNEMVADAPRFGEIAALVRRKLQGAVFVAHNARFDYSFLRSEFHKTDMSFSAKVLCTVKLSRRLFPEYARHNLDAVMERNGLTCGARHRALGDARVLHDFWFKLRRETADLRLAAAVRTVLGAHKLPAHLPADLADDLPEGPGVYRFFGADDALLYVGKSNSLRARVCAHFAAAGGESADRRLANQVRRVDWVETAGELGAMLRESEWIKTQKPLFNRRSKNQARSYTLRAGPSRALTGRAYPIEAIAIDAVDLADLTQCFGVFHSEKDARKALGDIARAQQLCLKVLGFGTARVPASLTRSASAREPAWPRSRSSCTTRGCSWPCRR